MSKTVVGFGDTNFTEEEFNEVIEAVKDINPVFAFEIEGMARVSDEDERDG